MREENKKVTISLDKETFDSLEKSRGLISRSLFVSTILSQVLNPEDIDREK